MIEGHVQRRFYITVMNIHTVSLDVACWSPVGLKKGLFNVRDKRCGVTNGPRLKFESPVYYLFTLNFEQGPQFLQMAGSQDVNFEVTTVIKLLIGSPKLRQNNPIGASFWADSSSR